MQGLVLALIGLAAGVCSGFFGIGGGIVLIPMLIGFLGFSQQEAQGTSLAVLVPPIGLLAAMEYYRRGFVQLPVVGWIVLGFVVGAWVAALVATQLPPAWLGRAFGLLLLYVGFSFLLAPEGGRGVSTAVPAAVASLTTGLAALVLRRKINRPSAAPPDAARDGRQS